MASGTESLGGCIGGEAAAVLEAHANLVAVARPSAPRPAKEIDELYRTIWRYASSVANTGGRTAESAARGHALLSFCAAANYFISSVDGYGRASHHPVREALMSAGMTLDEETAVVEALRVHYQRPGVLLEGQSARLGHLTQALILGSNNTFHHHAYRLPVRLDAWPNIAQPFYEAVVKAE